MENIRVAIQIEDPNLMPFYASEFAAGADVCASNQEPILLASGFSACIPTGLKVEIPLGYALLVCPRSGLANKQQVTVLNAPGIIDADYRGEIGVILINLGKDPCAITYGMRIAQLVLTPVFQALFIVQEKLSVTTRGEGGFGHTGTH